ncbi:MAG: hypothetical protein JXR88_08055 [Clostridia bacterium]|nr:hypothetical protein [Clostridia bacterium]
MREEYVHNPKKDFTRNRKISLRILIELLITMGAGSQNKDLLEFLKFDVSVPTSSALIQQRNKLKPSGLLFLLQEFTKTFTKHKTYRGYRLLAVDGSKVPIFRDPSDSETFAIMNQYDTGCNFLHVNALYDICNKLYLDATIQAYRVYSEFRGLIEMINRSSLMKKVILIADYAKENTILYFISNYCKYIFDCKNFGIVFIEIKEIEVNLFAFFMTTLKIICK